jgi:hypothetical protein
MGTDVADPLIEQLVQIVPDLVGMTNVLNVPDLGIALTLAAALVQAIEDELTTRTITPTQAKATVDAATQAAIQAKFKGQ